jgi:hypothetical protein
MSVPYWPAGLEALTASEREAALARGWWLTSLEPVAGDRLRVTVTLRDGSQRSALLEPGQLVTSTVEQLAAALVDGRRKTPGRPVDGPPRAT